jgi:hypothetical protein
VLGVARAAVAVEKGHDMDDDNEEIYYIDDDERNARVVRRVPPQRPGSMGGRRPRTVIVPSGSRSSSRPSTVVVQSPKPQSGLGGLSRGEIVEVAAQILAAIQPLPAPPTGSGQTGTDVENLVTYQGALATHAKRDEQLRTLGSLVGKLLK